VGQFSKHVLRKHAATGESDPVVDQLADDVLTLLADGRYVFQLDNEFAAVKICSRLLARILQLGCPGCNELPFQNQPTLGATINEGDPQHAVFLTHVTKAMGVPNQKARKVMNFQSGVGRNWLLKVNVVQDKIEQRHLVRSGELRTMVKGKLLITAKTGEYSFVIEAGSASVIQALSWVSGILRGINAELS
jgi:hypothetical protein